MVITACSELNPVIYNMDAACECMIGTRSPSSHLWLTLAFCSTAVLFQNGIWNKHQSYFDIRLANEGKLEIVCCHMFV